MDTEPEVWRVGRLCPNCGKPEHFGSAYCKPDTPEETFHEWPTTDEPDPFCGLS
jgi:hypothetical protein